jgi:stage II sporulation protein D
LRSATAAAYKQAIRIAAALGAVTIRAAAALGAVSALMLAPAARAGAASTFYIRGGGDGHGIGLSQYGAYGYALHGKSYRWILAHYYKGTSIGPADPRQTVRVLLSTGSATFSGATRAGDKRLTAATTYVVRPNANGSLTLLTAGSGKKVGQFGAPLTVTGRGPLSLAGMGVYRGAFEFQPDGSGGVQTVDAVGLEDYVRGVIAAEMPSGWSAEALKAQAVAARTYAITTDVGGSAFDLYADTRSQMYGGVAAETAAGDSAVAATRGQVVTDRGVPVVTYFFSSSGGHTENVENVWPGATPDPWLRGVPDPYDGAGGDRYHQWSYELSPASAAAKLGSWVKGSLIGIRVTKHGVSPRIITAVVVGTKGRTTVTGSQLQGAFGLLSTWATFTTISTVPGRVAGSTAGAAGWASGSGGSAGGSAGSSTQAHVSAESRAVLALVPLVQELVGAASGLHGTVFPAARRSRVAIQLRTRRGWRTVLHTRIGSGGGYDTALPGPGTYRILYLGLSGPAVTVS